MNNENLKPCPFCGGAGLVQIAPFARGLKKCPHCGGNGRVCVKQNAEKLYTKSVASNQLNAKLTYDALKKMVKPLKWEQECEDGDYIAWVDNGLLRIDCWDKDKYSVFFDLSILQTEDSLEKAKQFAQEFFVDLVAAALGVERNEQ